MLYYLITIHSFPSMIKKENSDKATPNHLLVLHSCMHSKMYPLDGIAPTVFYVDNEARSTAA